MHLTRTERVAKGKLARAEAPLGRHADFSPAPDRNPIAAGVAGRHPGAGAGADPVWADAHLAVRVLSRRCPDHGLRPFRATTVVPAHAVVRRCAHVQLRGVRFPERHLVFDLNDFDETLPGPFEWDVKRLAASIEIAGRGNAFKTKTRRKIVLSTVAAYQQAVRDFAGQTNLDVWYAHLDMDK